MVVGGKPDSQVDRINCLQQQIRQIQRFEVCRLSWEIFEHTLRISGSVCILIRPAR
jgi:hypothetical protein